MQVILITDVPKVGKRYDVVSVAPGFARNFLFAKGLAEAVTKGNAGRVAELKHKQEAEKKRQEEAIKKAFGTIKKTTVLEFARTANEEGHLYAGVTRADIAEELSKSLGVTIAESHIILDKPFKEVGSFPIAAEMGGKEVEFAVKIVAEKKKDEE